MHYNLASSISTSQFSSMLIEIFELLAAFNNKNITDTF